MRGNRSVLRHDQVNEERADGVKRLVEAELVLPGKAFLERTELLRRLVPANGFNERGRP